MIKPRMYFAHMRSALAYGATSYARRLQVGCVLVDPRTDQPVSIGWNGTAPGAPNVCEIEVDGELVSVGVIHAEENAMNRLPEHVDPWGGLVMFVSHSPCMECTHRIIESGYIHTVVYRVPYRITDGIAKMLNENIEVYQLTEDAMYKHYLDENGQVQSKKHMDHPGAEASNALHR